MILKSVSASQDVIGDPSRPGTNNSELLKPRREEREKVLGNRASFHFNRAGKRKKEVAYGGKKCIFWPERNVGTEGQERSAIGNEFQIVGAAKVNGYTTAFAVLHLVTLTTKDGSLQGSDHIVVTWKLKVPGPSQ